MNSLNNCKRFPNKLGVTMLLLQLGFATINSIAQSQPEVPGTKIYLDNTSNKVKEGDNKFNIRFQLEVNDSASTGLIIISKNEHPYKVIQSDGSKITVPLDLNAYYIIKCQKSGYATKAIYINTKVPAGRSAEEFAKFACIISLEKEGKAKYKADGASVGGIIYSNELKDFDFAKE